MGLREIKANWLANMQSSLPKTVSNADFTYKSHRLAMWCVMQMQGAS